ncbi:MAG TPA: hypothetical protein VIW45_20240 [Vicinamibacterales bacterium]|jgi:hypothetical protein
MNIIAIVHPSTVVLDLGWILLVAAAIVATAMIAVGMIEELPGIIRDTAHRTEHHE